MIVEGLVKLFNWIVKVIGPSALISLTLLAIILVSVVIGLSDVLTAVESVPLSMLALTGLATGWFLARTSLRGRTAGLIAFLTGLILVTFWVSNLDEQLVDLIGESINLIRQLLAWPWEGPPDLEAFRIMIQEIITSFAVPISRFLTWSWSLTSDERVLDPLAVELFWSFALWGVSIWAAWGVRRLHKPLSAVFPAGLLFAGTLNYVHTDTFYFLPILSASLILIAHDFYRLKIRQWEVEKLDYFEDIGLEMFFIVGGLILALTMGATITPSISIPEIVEKAQAYIGISSQDRDQAAEAFGLLRAEGGGSLPGAPTSSGLPRQNLLGSGPELSHEVVFLVSVEDLTLQTGSDGSVNAPRYYWRGLTFDRYTGTGWITTDDRLVEFSAGVPANEIEFPYQQEIGQSVQFVLSTSPEAEQLVLVAGELVTVDRDFSASWRSPEDFYGAVVRSPQYRATSLVNKIDDGELRQATGIYPDWVSQRYLQLPEGIPNRVLELSRELTAIEPTPYDRARAIEAYLRKIPYSLDIPAPPPGREVSDYFLFDLLKGYCDYYATAMVVLARASGLPSRLVTGYASGEFNIERGVYVVTAADAHSWVEVYFQGFGWVEFEPTGGRPGLDLPAQNLPEDFEFPETSTVPPNNPRTRGWLLWSGIILATVFGITLLLIGWSFTEGWRLLRLAPRQACLEVYRQLHNQGRRLLVNTPSGATPHEFAYALSHFLSTASPRENWRKLFQNAPIEIESITSPFVFAVYSPHQPGEAEKQSAVRSWLQLRWRLRLAALIVAVRAFFHRRSRG